MPVYEYYCGSCKWRFEQLQPMSRAGADATCPECGTVARRTLSVFAAVSRSGGSDFACEGGYSREAMPAGGCGAGCACAV